MKVLPYELPDGSPIEVEFEMRNGDIEAIDAVTMQGERIRLDPYTKAKFENDGEIRVMAIGVL